MATRDLSEARKAYALNDVELSLQAHLSPHKELHKDGGNFIKSFTYGGLDGIITTFAIVCSSVASNLDATVVVILGLSNVVADGLAMAFGDYLSTKSEIEFQKAEKARETWEVENNPEGEMLEMEELYVAKGMSHQDAKIMTQVLARNKQAWVEVMMVEELGLLEESDNPVKNALVTFFSFNICGIFPLLPFMIGLAFENPNVYDLFYCAVGATALTLFTLGAVKTRFTNVNMWLSGFETLVIGAIAAGAAYLLGFLLAPIAGSSA